MRSNMTEEKFKEAYFEWICQLMTDNEYAPVSSYRKLLRHLHRIDFSYTMSTDSNRAEDGIELRYRFGYENGYMGAIVATYLDNSPCTMLEMMVALAIRCEEHIMDDPDIGNRTGKWFWEMIQSLGLIDMDDSHFDPRYVESIISVFTDRKYKRNGAGGLFTIKDTGKDLRKYEIWYQMCWYLNENMREA